MKQDKIIKTLAKKSFFKLASRKSSIQRELFFHNFFTGHGVTGVLIPGKNRVYDYYLDEKEFKRVSSFYQKKIIDAKYWGKHIDNFKGLFIEVIRLSKLLKANPSAQNYKRYMLSMEKVSIYFVIPWFIDEGLLLKTRDLFIKKYGLDSWKKAEPTITSQTRLTQTNIFTMDILESIINKSLVSNLPKFVEKYSWLDIFAPDDEIKITKDYFLRYAKEYPPKKAKEYLNKIRNEVRQNKQVLTRLIKDIDDQKLRRLITVANSYVTIRTERTEYWRNPL